MNKEILKMKVANKVKKIKNASAKIMRHLTAADHDGSGQWSSPYEDNRKTEQNKETKK